MSIQQDMRIFKKSEGYLPIEFLKYGIDHCQASIDLFAQNKPSTFDSAGHLMHLGLEQILKAWHLEIFGKFTDTHSLTTLVSCLTGHGVKIAKKYQKTLKEIDSYEKIKYPRNVEGPIEIGDEDIMIKIEFIVAIYRQLPEGLIQAYNSAPKTKGGRVLMRRPKGKK